MKFTQNLDETIIFTNILKMTFCVCFLLHFVCVLITNTIAQCTNQSKYLRSNIEQSISNEEYYFRGVVKVIQSSLLFEWCLNRMKIVYVRICNFSC